MAAKKKFRRGAYYNIRVIADLAGGSMSAVIAAARVCGVRVIGNRIWTSASKISQDFIDELALAVTAERAAERRRQERMIRGKESEAVNSNPTSPA